MLAPVMCNLRAFAPELHAFQSTVTCLCLGADADEAGELAVRLLLHGHVHQRILTKHAPVRVERWGLREFGNSIWCPGYTTQGADSHFTHNTQRCALPFSERW